MLFGWWSFRSGKLVGRLLLLKVDGGDSFSLSSWGVLFLLGLGIFFEYFLKCNQKLCKYHIQYNVVLSIFIECKLLWISCWSTKLNAYELTEIKNLATTCSSIGGAIFLRIFNHRTWFKTFCKQYITLHSFFVENFGKINRVY